MDRFEEARRALVETLRRQGMHDPAVLQAIGSVRREAFVPPELADRAYENVALPIGRHQTISQPLVVAQMTRALGLAGPERVLEVGTGSGYQAAVLATLAASVISLERVPELSAAAGRALAALGYGNVELRLSDGSLGWPAGAPYDRIIVTAAGPSVPESLLRQLADGGRLVMPVGTRSQQELVLMTRRGHRFEETRLGGVRFVPLIGEAGWSLDAQADPDDTDHKRAPSGEGAQ